MRKQAIIVFCAACVALGAQGQSPSDASGSPSSTTAGEQSFGKSHHHGYGSMGQGQEIRASQLTGAQVTGSSGQTLGTISDCIINDRSGRIDFAILSLSENGVSSTSTSPGSTGAATSPGSSSSSLGSSPTPQGGATSPGSSSTGASAAGGKQIAVPWALLRPSMTGAQSAQSATQQPAFTFAGDTSKLQSAPAFDPNTDLTQANWRQSVFSFYGLSGAGTATGGAESPGGSSSSSSPKQ